MSQVESNIKKAKQWLQQDVYPLWSRTGLDEEHGGFYEALSFTGEPLRGSRRAMVQSRQIYAFLTGAKLNCIDTSVAHKAVHHGVQSLIQSYSLPSGAFMHSVEEKGSPKNAVPDLYTQAFALFGLAQAYSLTPTAELKDRALHLYEYLRRERAVPGGGYTELDEKGQASYKSNPHMHLFEGALAWMQVDSAPQWKELAAELCSLCLNKFIHPSLHVLGEYFDNNWNPLLQDGRFIYEPGHQYEWAWLLKLYEELTQQDLKAVRHQLFSLAEKHGVSTSRKVAYDEMWSDFTPKTLSSRFWPQCERIKAACRLGTEVPSSEQAAYSQAADEALETLFKFFATPKPGLWFDMLSAEDVPQGHAAKASSLYHIVNALEEYVLWRPKLKGFH
ncbi:MAG: AGE family epimerase/isomerase [Bdellovibrio sp.]